MTDLDELRALVRQSMKDKHMSQQATAEACGVGTTTLLEFLTKDRNISVYNLLAICDYLEIKITFSYEPVVKEEVDYE